MTILDDIIADVEIEMTEDLIRAFRIEGCDPACHCCEKTLEAGKMFKLAVVETADWWANNTVANDEMLCCDCTAEMLIQRKIELAKTHHKDLDRSRNGYTRKHVGKR